MGKITARNMLKEVIGIINKPSLLHLVGCLYYCINDARSYKHQIDKFRFEVLTEVNINSAVFCDVTRYKNTQRHTQENYRNSETAIRAKVNSLQQWVI